MGDDSELHPRLCTIRKRPDFQGYGFNLHAEKGRAGLFIGKVDADSPAEAAGMKEGDRIVEVEGVNIGDENHSQVVTRIKAAGESVTMLLVDSATDKYFKQKIVVSNDIPQVVRMSIPLPPHPGADEGFNMATSISKSSEAASYCDPCQQINNTTTIAVYFCADCRHELCSNCEVHHSKTLLTRNHKVTKLQDNVGKESDFQVSGRRPGGKAAKAWYVRGSDQCTDIIQRVQGVTLSTGSGTSSTADRAGRVFKAASLKKGVDVSSESDAWLCTITGIVLLQDRMIVSDLANSKLKVFDSDYTLQFEHKCDSMPGNIDMVDNTTVVVGFLDRRMKVLSVGRDSMVGLVNIDTEYPCYGVCCHDGKIYCVVGAKLNSQYYSEIREYILDGALTRKFDYLSDGKVDCNALNYITVNPRTGTLYVTDWEKGMVALTTTGHVTAVMSLPQVKNPLGIAVDDHGQIYVCGCGSHKVIQISEDGSRVEELLSNNPRCKFAQCVKIYGNKMFFARRESDTVFIYELS